MSIIKCQWYDEQVGNETNPTAFEEEHISCQKAYRRGQQWAIQTLRGGTKRGSIADEWADWLEKHLKDHQ